MKPENPPAFPNFDEVDQWDKNAEVYREVMLPLGGMTLRDYFAAHAPKNPQSWFRPRLSSEWSKHPDVPNGLHPDSLRVVENWLDDPIWDLENDIEDPGRGGRIAERDCPALRTFVAAMRAHWAHNDNLRKEEAVERFKQWPYGWADAMLAERAK